MRVKVMGYKHIQGVSKKTEQPYDGMLVSVEYAEPGFTGVKCETNYIDMVLIPSEWDFAVLPFRAALDYNGNGMVCGVDILPPDE